MPRSQSNPRTLMRKMSSVCRIGISGLLKTSSVSLIHCSRETNSGGCQFFFSAFMMISYSEYLPQSSKGQALFTAETPSSQSSECFFDQEFFTQRSPRLSLENWG